MKTKELIIHNTGIIDGVLCVLRDELISIDDFWSILQGLDFDKDEVLNARLGDFTVSDILESI